jgi:monoamine oxidase
MAVNTSVLVKVCFAMGCLHSLLLIYSSGNLQFSHAIASELTPNSVKLSCPVTSITQTGGGRCLTSCGSTNLSFRSKKVILSVPTPLYSHINFSPPLPADKHEAVTSSFLGYTSKALVVYSSPWWREQGYSGVSNSDCGPIGFTRDTSVDQDGQYSMVCFMVGDNGRKWSRCDHEEKIRQVTEQIKTMFGCKGNVVPPPDKVLLQDWSKEEYIWGAPCPVMGLGSMAKGGMNAIKRPFRNLHFVGTETSDVWKGYMEGAVRSGRRGAAEVTQELLEDRVLSL